MNAAVERLERLLKQGGIKEKQEIKRRIVLFMATQALQDLNPEELASMPLDVSPKSEGS